jgi:prophage regulatory protein
METTEITRHPLRVLRLPAVKAKTGYPTSTIYGMMSRGEFPRPIHLGPNTRGWVESEIDAYLERLIAQRDNWQRLGDAAARVVSDKRVVKGG